MRRIILLAALLSASACTSFEPLRPDMEARPLPSRADEIAYINELRKAYTLDDASRIPCYAGVKLRSFRPKYVQGYPDYDSEQDVAAYAGKCLRFAKDPGDAAITSYLESGFGLTDLYCQRFFTVATEERQTRQLQRGLFKTGDTLTNAVMAALSASANAIAISSAGFSAIDSGYGNVDDAFVIAPSRDDVRKLVLSAQQKFRADVFKKDDKGQLALPKSYASARATIERYAGICSFDGMRQQVADAVATKTTDQNDAAQATANQGGQAGQAGQAGNNGGKKAPESKMPLKVTAPKGATTPASSDNPPPISPK